MRSSGEGPSPVGAWRIATPAIAGAVLVQCSSAPSPPAATSPTSIVDTSAFNCRDIPGTGRWSQHAFGRAIDLNPLLNPEIDRTGAFQPKNAAPYLDRHRTDPGVLHAGDAAVRIFTDRGWRWGGDWRTPKDYQHFER